jgi:hypothetical protein
MCRLVNSPAVATSVSNEAGVRHEVRRWRMVRLDDDQPGEEELNYIEYRYWTRGMLFVLDPLAASATPSNLVDCRRQRWTLLHNDKHGKKDRREVDWSPLSHYQPHPLVRGHFLELFHQYAQRHDDLKVRVTAQQPHLLDLQKIEFVFHDHLTIAGRGIFNGFNMFNIFATSFYGDKHHRRERYDIVEVVIPMSAGGEIAGSDKLLRTSDDSAFAKVLGIIEVRGMRQNLCLLQVAFLTTGAKQQRSGFDKMCSNTRIAGMYYGQVNTRWVALYPLQTIKAPALAIPDHKVRGNNVVKGWYFVFALQYFLRGGWSTEIEYDNDWELHLPSLRVAEAPDDMTSDDEDVRVTSDEED